MPTYTPKRLAQAVLSTSSASMYVAPASTATILSEIVLANTSAVAADATVYLIPTPGTVGSNSTDATTIVPAVSIPAKSTKVISLHQVLNTSDILAAKASASTSITLTASGVEMV